MAPKKLTTYCTNAGCPAASSCGRFTRRKDENMPVGTTALKFVVPPGGVHCGSYIRKVGGRSIAQLVMQEVQTGKDRYRKVMVWLRKSRVGLSTSKRAIENNIGKMDDIFGRSNLTEAHDEISKALNATGGPDALPDSFDILEYLKKTGRHI
jgi:hypothetical protein